MWTTKDPNSIPLEEAEQILSDPDNRRLFPNQYKLLLQSLQFRLKAIKESARLQNPLAWVQPSYEQTLKLNAWVHGINYIVDFDANRVGKTTAGVLNTLLWLIPTAPDYVLHTPYTDHRQRTFHTLPRPNIAQVSAIHQALLAQGLKPSPLLPYDDPQNLESSNFALSLPPSPLPPGYNPNAPRTIWIGAPDNPYHEQIIMPEFKKWIPPHLIEDYSTYSRTIRLATTPPTTLLFKSYDAKETTWSGAAVQGIMLTEGVPQDVINEVKQRYAYPAFASWDYTPYEQRNTQSKSAYAYKVFQGKEILPLHPYVFSGFGITDAPDYILPPDKKADLQRMWANKPEGEARIHGKFFSSSPVILSNYNPDIHALPTTLQQLQQKYAPRPLLYFRGLDPGWGHVTACCWMALAPDNTRYIYRFYSRPQRSIEERCSDIIALSNNTRQPHPSHTGTYQEVPPIPPLEGEKIQITWIDYHTFKTDENTKQPFATNYIRNGLVVRPSITYGPEQRASLLNNLLLPQPHLPHPTTSNPPGSKIYFLINEPGVAAALQKITELYWTTYEKGDKAGLPKDKIQDYDDDELDAVCYVTCPVINYSGFFSSVGEKKTSQTPEKRLSYSNIRQLP